MKMCLNAVLIPPFPLSIRGLLMVFLLVATSGCSRSPESAIEHILDRCADYSGEINQSEMSAAQAAESLARFMQGLDTRDCPPEFREAFQRHINAWSLGANCFAQNRTLNAFLEGFAAGFFWEPSFFGQTEREIERAVYEINTTYGELTAIAARYGARVPVSVIE